MTKATMKTRRTLAAFSLFGFAVAFCAVTACGSSQSCDNIGGIDEFATLELACPSTNIKSVEVSGPCNTGDAGEALSHYSDGPGALVVGSASAGVCRVELTFADGFTYATDVTFTSTTDSCGTRTISPTQSTFVVNNPASTCTDGGR